MIDPSDSFIFDLQRFDDSVPLPDTPYNNIYDSIGSESGAGDSYYWSGTDAYVYTTSDETGRTYRCVDLEFPISESCTSTISVIEEIVENIPAMRYD